MYKSKVENKCCFFWCVEINCMYSRHTQPTKEGLMGASRSMMPIRVTAKCGHTVTVAVMSSGGFSGPRMGSKGAAIIHQAKTGLCRDCANAKDNDQE